MAGRRVYLLLTIFLPVLAAQRKPHSAGSVRLLKVNETVHSSRSDLVFSWAKCVICDGYEARLFLQDLSGKREIPYQLKSAVTALKISDVPPRTVYRFVVKRLPSDASTSEVSGRSFSPEAPQPVKNLVARVLTNSSIQIEWKAKNADGFVIKILEDKTLVQEKVIPDFSNHTILNISSLKPETSYSVQVTAFYFPPSGKSISEMSSARVKTLPSVLPNIHLRWDPDVDRKLVWDNPEFPAPLAHTLNCTYGDPTNYVIEFSGATSFAIWPEAVAVGDLQCTLETIFSVDRRASVRAQITKARTNLPAAQQTTSNHLNCYYGDGGSVEVSLNYKPVRVNGIELLDLSYSKTHPPYVEFLELDYRLCSQHESCNDRPWMTVRQTESFTLIQKPGSLEAWIPYTVSYKGLFRCHNGGQTYTTIRTLELPGLAGPLPPVTELLANSSGVFWKYNSTLISPDYFLVTHCAADECMSESVPGEHRKLSLGKMRRDFVHYVTVQAVKQSRGRAYASLTEMTSVAAPEAESPENVTLTFSEVLESPTIHLAIAHNSSVDFPPVVEYHIDICREPVLLWNDTTLGSLLVSNRSCESVVSTNTSLDLDREPWTLYNVSVIACYGSFDSNEPVNATLPIFKQKPGQVSELSWSRENASLSWSYDSSILSGFSVLICASRTNASESCRETLTGPLDRQYLVHSSGSGDDEFWVFVTPFVTYGGRFFNGTRSELGPLLAFI